MKKLFLAVLPAIIFFASVSWSNGKTDTLANGEQPAANSHGMTPIAG